MYCYLNGEIIPQAEAQIGINDLAIIRGYGIFDYFIFQHYQPHFLSDYLDRFYRSGERMLLSLPMSKAEMADAIHAVIQKNEKEEGGIRLVLTGGYSEDGFSPPKQGNFMIMQGAIPWIPTEKVANGVTAATFDYQREWPGVKTTNYLTGIRLLPWLKERKAEYLIYHDGTFVRESDRSNFFIVDANGTIVTAKDKVLPGITRSKIIEVAHRLGLPIEVRDLRVEELNTAREAFFTSSVKATLGITTLDGKAVGDGQVGPITKQLYKGFEELLAEYFGEVVSG